MCSKKVIDLVKMVKTTCPRWEKIEEILEGMGYKVWTNKFYDDPRGKFLCKIAIQYRKDYVPKELARARANSAQQAVMQAVIKLEGEK